MDSLLPGPLTPKEKLVLEFIENFFLKNKFSPTFTEIKDHFGFASFNSIQRYLNQLQKKKYISKPGGNQKRALTLLHPSNTLHADYLNKIQKISTLQPETLSIPLLGRVAAGVPMEAKVHDIFTDAPASLVPHPSKTFALIVEGDSMIEDGIHDGDTLFIQQQNQANKGEIIVATVDNEATVKRFHPIPNKGTIELRPANSTMKPMLYPDHKVKVEGVVVGLIRKF